MWKESRINETDQPLGLTVTSEVKDIKGVKANAICSRNLAKVCRYMKVIKKEGIVDINKINPIKRLINIFFIIFI